NNAAISIRGRSTIFANPNPLIVVDNFPYDGELSNINPNDIESVTILKDAAAASIWGVQAGNGVIVITTKNGSAGEKVRVSFNATTSISGKVDLHYGDQMSSSDYVDLEQYLFNNGYFDRTINNGYGALSPAVEVMNRRRTGLISQSDSIAFIDRLKEIDVRNDLERYIYQRSINQQYALSLDGGSPSHRYYISVGYDKNIPNIVANSQDRFTINAKNTLFLLENKLQISSGVFLASANTKGNTASYTAPFAPYEELRDEEGNALAVVRSNGLRESYTDTAGNGHLLDWKFRPLDENYSNYDDKLTDYKLNARLNYTILPALSLMLNYQYQKGVSDYRALYSENSFYVRDLVNSYSQLDYNTGAIDRPVPLGAIVRNIDGSYFSNYGRVQFAYSPSFGKYHEIHAIAGLEVKDHRLKSKSHTVYGYNISDASHIPVDYLENFPLYYSGRNSRIPEEGGSRFAIDRFRSIFFNASYIYDGRYVVSASAR